MADTNHPDQSTLNAFEDHFSAPSRYGERWHKTLYPALKDNPRHAMLYNRYAPLQDFHHVAASPESLDRLRFPSATDDIQADNLVCFLSKKDEAPPAPENTTNGLLTHCNLESAIVLVIHILQVLPGDNVLDLCATPGGNSIALAQSLWPYLQPDSPTPPLPGAKKGVLHSNEINPTSNSRLTKTLAQYLPASGQQEVFQLDVSKGAIDLPLGVGGYDKVLVDVPCSDERRIVQVQPQAAEGEVAQELAGWSSSASERIAEAQWRCLFTALRAVRIGGRVLYTTTSISHEENDEVIEKALDALHKGTRTRSWAVSVEKLEEEVERALEAGWAERTAMGWTLLPDHSSGRNWGPRYFCVLTKQSE